MKKLILLSVLAIATAMSAQVLTINSMRKLDTSAFGSDARVAAFSPDGSYLLLTSRSQKGLGKYDLRTATFTPITIADAAGYNPVISADGQQIIYQERLIAPNRQVSTRYFCRNLSTQSTTMAPSRAAMNATSVSISEDLKVRVSSNGQTYTLAPQGTQYSYIWAELSPNGNMISYFCSEIGGFVCDLQGNVICEIGDQCHAAKWYNNTTLIGMEYHSNGQRTTSSCITARTLDGRFQRLTNSNVIALYPQVARGKIAFSTPEGEVYLLDVK